MAPANNVSHERDSSISFPIRRTTLSAARMTAEPALTRATPIFSSSGRLGHCGVMRIFNGAATAFTNLAIVSRLLTPGAKTQSAPASRYARNRSTVRSRRVASSPLGITGHVFQVHSNCARIDRRFHGFRHVLHGSAVPGFHVRRYRNVNGARNPRDHIQHLVPRDSLTVRIASRKGDRCAAGRNGGMSAFFQNPRADPVPGICKHEHFRPVMELSELLGFFSLHSNVHRKTSKGEMEKSSRMQSLKFAATSRNGQFGKAFRALFPGNTAESVRGSILSLFFQNFRQNDGLVVLCIF